MEIRNRLTELRERRGTSVPKLATAAGISRQSLYSIEAGTYIPNTVITLRLARALSVNVEEIFALEEANPAQESVRAILLPSPEMLQVGQALRLCNVGDNVVAFFPEIGTNGMSAFEGVLSARPKGTDGRDCEVEAFDEKWKAPDRLLIAGCDPSASLLTNHLHREDVELLVTYQNSACSLDLLKQGLVHVAGTHAVDKKTGAFDMKHVRETLGTNAVVAIGYATWEEGFTLAAGNPKGITGVSDLRRRDVRIVNREPGAACRNLLDSLLHEHDVSSEKVSGYNSVAYGHFPAARQVLNGEADVCISTRSAARIFGLEFISLATRPYHLITFEKYLKLPTMEALLKLLQRESFRHDLEVSAGYDMREAGVILSETGLQEEQEEHIPPVEKPRRPRNHAEPRKKKSAMPHRKLNRNGKV